MRHDRDGDTKASRRSEFTRLIALIATFLLLVAGVLVSAPGLMTASASGSTTATVDDESDDDEADDESDDDECKNPDEGDEDEAEDDETSTTVDEDEDNDESDDEVDDEDGDESDDEDGDESDDEGDDESDDEGDDDGDEDGDESDDEGDEDEFEADSFEATTADADEDEVDDEDDSSTSDDEDDEGDEDDDEGGHHDVEDDDDDVEDDNDADEDEDEGDEDDDDADDDEGDEDDDEGDEDDDETSTTVDEDDDDDDENCNVATTIEVHKSLGDSYGGTLAPEDFSLLLDGQPVDHFVDIPVTPGLHTVSEHEVFGYELRAILCTDLYTNEHVSYDGDVTVEAGQQISCEVVNDEVPPSITLTKEVITDDGGVADPSFFTLTINGDAAAQEMPYTDVLANQVAVVSEEPTFGYAIVSIDCTSDLAQSPNTTSIEGDSLELTPVLGENITCVITNDDIAPTVTIEKVVVGSDESPAAFQMLLGGDPVNQGEAIAVAANTPIEVSEVADPDYVSSIECVDLDDPEQALANPLELYEGQNALCTVTNTFAGPDDAVGGADVAIDQSVSQTTVGAAGQFNWILDITNSGPNVAADLVVSDTLPAQFEVLAAFPPVGVTCTNTTSAVQCTAPSLAVGDSLHIVVQVRVVANAAAGTATNTATVSTTSNDPNTANNTDSASIGITAVQGLPPTGSDVSSGAPPAAELPRTGSSIAAPLTLASLLVAGGLFSLVIARRRRAATAQ